MIIAIAGTHGAGKGTVVDYLKGKGFVHLSARELIKEEVAKRGLEPTRPNISATVTDMRNTISPLWVVETLLARAQAQGGNVVIESIYTLAEVDYLRSRGAIVLAIDADVEKRYERIVGRGSETDHITFGEFKAQQEKELASTDPNSQNVQAVMQVADHLIVNNDSTENLFEQVEKLLNR
jgi:dephospho-CoA kinase